MKLESFTRTCNVCPSQWNATLEDGRPAYIRYRNALFTVEVAPIGVNPISDGTLVAEMNVRTDGSYGDGFMTDEDMLKLVDSIPLPEPKEENKTPNKTTISLAAALMGMVNQHFHHEDDGTISHSFLAANEAAISLLCEVGLAEGVGLYYNLLWENLDNLENLEPEPLRYTCPHCSRRATITDYTDLHSGCTFTCEHCGQKSLIQPVTLKKHRLFLELQEENKSLKGDTEFLSSQVKSLINEKETLRECLSYTLQELHKLKRKD